MWLHALFRGNFTPDSIIKWRTRISHSQIQKNNITSSTKPPFKLKIKIKIKKEVNLTNKAQKQWARVLHHPHVIRHTPSSNKKLANQYIFIRRAEYLVLTEAVLNTRHWIHVCGHHWTPHHISSTFLLPNQIIFLSNTLVPPNSVCNFSSHISHQKPTSLLIFFFQIRLLLFFLP